MKENDLSHDEPIELAPAEIVSERLDQQWMKRYDKNDEDLSVREVTEIEHLQNYEYLCKNEVKTSLMVGSVNFQYYSYNLSSIEYLSLQDILTDYKQEKSIVTKQLIEQYLHLLLNDYQKRGVQ